MYVFLLYFLILKERKLPKRSTDPPWVKTCETVKEWLVKEGKLLGDWECTRNFVFSTPKSVINIVPSFILQQPCPISTEIHKKLHCRCINLGQNLWMSWVVLGSSWVNKKKSALIVLFYLSCTIVFKATACKGLCIELGITDSREENKS